MTQITTNHTPEPNKENTTMITKPTIARWELDAESIPAATKYFNTRMKATPIYFEAASVGKDMYEICLVNVRGTESNSDLVEWAQIIGFLDAFKHGPRAMFYVCPECKKTSPVNVKPGVTRPYHSDGGTKTCVLDCGHTVVVEQTSNTPQITTDQTDNNKEKNIVTTNETTEEVWIVEYQDANDVWQPYETFPSRTEAEQMLLKGVGKYGSKSEYRLISPHTGRIWRYNMWVNTEIVTYEIEGDLGRTTIITNHPTPSERASIELVTELREQGKQGVCMDPYGRDNEIRKALIANSMVFVEPSIGNKNWVYQELQDLVESDDNVIVRVEIVQTPRDKSTIEDEDWHAKMETASFGFSDHNSTTFFHVWRNRVKVTWEEFPALMNLEFRNSVNLVKRLKELTRVTMLRNEIPDTELKIHLVPVPMSEILRGDGNIVFNLDTILKPAILRIPDPETQRRSMRRARPSLFLPNPFTGVPIRLSMSEWVRFNVRFLMTENTLGWLGDQGIYLPGLLKGDGEAVPAEVLAERWEDELGFVPDIVMAYGVDDNGNPVEAPNVKPEIRSTNGKVRMTFMPHHAHHDPKSNDLMFAMVGEQFFPIEELTYTDRKYIGNTLKEFEAGEFPSYMKTTEAKGAKKEDGSPNLGAIVQNLIWKWWFARKDYTPNPLRESSFLMKLGTQGFRNMIDKRNGTRQVDNDGYFRKDSFGNDVRKNVSLRLPLPFAMLGHVLTMTIVDMAGYDPAAEGFDTTKVFYYERMHSLVYPDHIFMEEASRHGGWDQDDTIYLLVRRVFDGDKYLGVKALSIRMPVGYGEYTITEVDVDSLPLYNTYTGPGCPWGQNQPPAIDISNRRPYVDELQGLGLQTVTFEDPDSQLEFRELDPIYTRAEANIGITTMLANPGVGRIINMLAAYASATGLPFPVQSFRLEEYVDFCQKKYNLQAFQIINEELTHFAELVKSIPTEIDNWIWVNRVKAPVPVGVKLVNDGYYTQLSRHQLEMTRKWDEAVKALTVKTRSPIDALMGIELPDDIVKEAQEMVREFGKDNLKRFGFFSPENAQRIYRGEINRKYVERLKAMPEGKRNKVLVAAYQHTIKTGTRDNFFFQTPLMNNEDSVMDLFLRTLAILGLAEVIVEGKGEGEYLTFSKKGVDDKGIRKQG